MKATLKPDFLVHDIAGEQILIGGGEQINFSAAENKSISRRC